MKGNRHESYLILHIIFPLFVSHATFARSPESTIGTLLRSIAVKVSHSNEDCGSEGSCAKDSKSDRTGFFERTGPHTQRGRGPGGSEFSVCSMLASFAGVREESEKVPVPCFACLYQTQQCYTIVKRPEELKAQFAERCHRSDGLCRIKEGKCESQAYGICESKIRQKERELGNVKLHWKIIPHLDTQDTRVIADVNNWFESKACTERVSYEVRHGIGEQGVLRTIKQFGTCSAPTRIVLDSCSDGELCPALLSGIQAFQERVAREKCRPELVIQANQCTAFLGCMDGAPLNFRFSEGACQIELPECKSIYACFSGHPGAKGYAWCASNGKSECRRCKLRSAYSGVFESADRTECEQNIGVKIPESLDGNACFDVETVGSQNK